MTPTLRVILVLAGAIACALTAIRAFPADRDALRRIVQEQCLVHWTAAHLAAPCERIVVPQSDPDLGYAVLADRKGGAHFLLIPTKTLVGVESPELIAVGTPNYFGAAWDARDRLTAAAGRAVRREAVGLALNPKRSRSQDQLHIHIECLRADVAQSLKDQAAQLAGTWTTVAIAGSTYHAMRVMGDRLGVTDPFKVLAEHLPENGTSMEDYSLVVAGMQFKEGPGFAVLAGTGLAGELLLDSTCGAA